MDGQGVWLVSVICLLIVDPCIMHVHSQSKYYTTPVSYLTNHNGEYRH